MRIGALEVEPPLVLAPMAGITDSPFRRMLRRIGGVGLLSMEFVSSEAVTRGVEPELGKLRFHPEERPLSIQVYGADPRRMAEAARQAEAAGADVVDINMGCPANAIVRNGAGAALGANLPLARKVVRAVRTAVSVPVTVKFRLGLTDSRMTFLELGRICQDEGVDAVTLHPRTARQQYAGQADWDRIAELVEALEIPVIGNGDVRSPEDALRMFDTTRCSAVMIGRAVLKDPWIFRKTLDRLSSGTWREPTLEERAAFVLDHFRILEEELEGRALLHKLKVFTGKYTHGLPGGRELRGRLDHIADPAELLAAVEAFFERMVSHPTT